MLGRLRTVARAAVNRRAGGVNQRHAVLQTPVEQFLRVGEVVVQHVPSVRLGRVGAGSLVQERAGFQPGGAAADELAELGAVHVVGDLAVAEVAKLVAMSQVIDGQDVPDAAIVEGADQVTSDETSGSGHDMHGVVSSRGSESLSPLYDSISTWCSFWGR